MQSGDCGHVFFMGKTLDSITPELREWIAEQQMFTVATAPLSGEGHVNCSPKGGDTFRVLGDREVAYLDFTGSGAETIAHLRENGRIVILFAAFSGPPRIVRLHGRGEAIFARDPRFPSAMAHFQSAPGVRSIIRVTVTRVSSSCGYSVPRYNYVGPRDTLTKWCSAKSEEELSDYRRKKNRVSIDGLPAVESE